MPDTASNSISISSLLMTIAGHPSNYAFPVERFEINPANQHELPQALGRLLLESYRDKDMLREHYQAQDREVLFRYLEDYVFPTDRNGISHGRPETAVRSGDFGEVILLKIATDVHGLMVPLAKMMWKLRNDRSSFCTDIFAHNYGSTISDLHYYEVKVRQALARDTSRRRAGTFYIAVIAHDSLAGDQDLPSEQIADFLRRQSFELARQHDANGSTDAAAEHRRRSVEYGRVVDDRRAHARNYCVGLVLDKTAAFDEQILRELEQLPPELQPLKVTIVLLDDLASLLVSSFKHAFTLASELVYGGTD